MISKEVLMESLRQRETELHELQDEVERLQALVLELQDEVGRTKRSAENAWSLTGLAGEYND